MSNDGTDWEGLVDQRLAEARRNRQAEDQAAQPPPGPEAAVKVVERIRAAGAAGAQDHSEESPLPLPPSPAEAGTRRRGAVRPPMSERERRVSECHLRSFSWRRARRTVFLLLLVLLFLGGVGLVFSPQLKKIFGFLAPDRETAENGLIAPPGPTGKPEPAKPVQPPAGQSPATTTKPPVPKEPAPEAPKPEPDPEVKREPILKPPEKKPEDEVKPVLPLEPAKPVDPSVMPEPPKPPEIPTLPKGPWDDQGKENVRPVDPRDSVG